MKIKKKFTLEIIILSIILAITSFIIIDNTLKVEENFSILNEDLIPRLSLLKDMRLMASNVLISTLEFTMFEENYKISGSKEFDITHSSKVLSEIDENKILFIQLFELYKHQVSEINAEESIEQINLKWERFTILSDKFVDYRKKGISGDAFIKIKDEFKNSTNTGGTATADTDYAAVSKTIVFLTGAATGAERSFSVQIKSDEEHEDPDETVVLTMAGPVVATLGPHTPWQVGDAQVGRSPLLV